MYCPGVLFCFWEIDHIRVFPYKDFLPFWDWFSHGVVYLKKCRIIVLAHSFYGSYISHGTEFNSAVSNYSGLEIARSFS